MGTRTSSHIIPYLPERPHERWTSKGQSCSIVTRRAGVAQLVRALACQARGRGFKSRHSRQISWRDWILGNMQEVSSISISELSELAQRMYGELVKGVVDINKQRLVIDAEMHSDEEAFLLESGSKQQDLWGINLYPADYGTEDFIEFDSMINIRPSKNNRSRSVEDSGTCELISSIVDSIVHE